MHLPQKEHFTCLQSKLIGSSCGADDLEKDSLVSWCVGLRTESDATGGRDLHSSEVLLRLPSAQPRLVIIYTSAQSFTTDQAQRCLQLRIQLYIVKVMFTYAPKLPLAELYWVSTYFTDPKNNLMKLASKFGQLFVLLTPVIVTQIQYNSQGWHFLRYHQPYQQRQATAFPNSILLIWK